MMVKVVFHHSLLLLLFCAALFFVPMPINTQRYGSHGYGSGTYGTNYWGSGYSNPRTQPSYGYGGQQQNRYRINEQKHSDENGQFGRPNWWAGRGEGAQWGQQNQQQGNNREQQFGEQYPSKWPKTQGQGQPPEQQPQQFPSPPPQQKENNWNNGAASSTAQQNHGKLNVDLPPGAPGTAEAVDSDQSRK